MTYDSNTSKATLDPGSDLAPNTSYMATVKGGPTGAEDAAGNALQQDYSWTLTTAPLPPPTVVGYTPTQTTGVPKNVRPTATFSTNMDGATITAASIKLQVYNSTTKKWFSVAHATSYDPVTRTATVGQRVQSKSSKRAGASTTLRPSCSIRPERRIKDPWNPYLRVLRPHHRVVVRAFEQHLRTDVESLLHHVSCLA